MAGGHGGGGGGRGGMGQGGGDEIDFKKIFDRQLYSKLFYYAKPYKLHFIAIFLIVIVSVACEMSLPLISRHIIDHFINPKYKLISLNIDQNSFQAEDYKSLLIKLDQDNYLVDQRDENKFLVNDRKFLLDNKLISAENFYFVHSYNVQQQELKKFPFADYPQIGNYPGGLIIKYGDLEKLDEKAVSIIRYNDVKSVKYYALVYLAIMILSFIFSYLQVYAITVMGQHIMYDIRLKLFNHLEKMPVQYFDKNPVGVLVTRVTNDINNLEEFFSAVLVSLFKDIFIIASVLGILISMDISLALISFVILPMIILVTIFFKKRNRKVSRWVRTSIARVNAMLSEHLSGMSIIQIFNREKLNYKKFTDQNHDYFKASFSQMMLNAILNPLLTFIRYFAIALILFTGSRFIIAAKISVGTLVAFLAYIEKFFEPIQDISEKVNLMQSALASSERIFGLLDLPAETDNGTHNPGTEFKGRIEFKDIWFAYTEENWVLKNFNLVINPGDKIALVGPTGAGKTSVINILNRFYPIQKGEILIDGVNINNLPLAVLRRYIGVVQQDVFLFAGSIGDNIRLNNSALTDDDLARVAKDTNAHEFIEKLPQKFDSQLKEGGVSISVGQRQLVSFSRMLAYDPQILVLDEATSNIDTETEILIQDALTRLMDNRTSIIVAHRLSTIQHCDKIVVIHKGEIKETGTHQELLATAGIYYNLYLLQYKDQLKS